MDRIQRTRKEKLPPNTLVITRPGKWGNPFLKRYARENNYRVVKKFREWVYAPEQARLRRDFIDRCIQDGIEHVACWCEVQCNVLCHGDIWLEIWNNRETHE